MQNSHFSSTLRRSQAAEACRILQKAGYQAYFVGGCVRDQLLELDAVDIDITTSALPDEVMKLFPHHYLTGLQHGTISVSIGTDIKNIFEITTFRTEGKYTDGRRPESVKFVKKLELDLARRDFTVNSMAYDPISKELKDPFYGSNDLKFGLITSVGDPNQRFQEDGLRIMRAARFAARFNFQIDSGTFQGMKNNLSTLEKVSKERIKDELCKILMTERASYGLMLLQKCGALELVCPLIKNLKLNNFTPKIDDCLGELETRLAFLYYGAKPKEVKEELVLLKFSNKEIAKTTFLLELLDRFMVFKLKNTALAYKSFMAVIKNHTPDTFEHELNEFIILSEGLGYNVRGNFATFVNEIVFGKNELLINGHDLIDLGIPQGSEIKKILETCYLEILKYPDHNDKKYLIELVKINYLGGGYI